MTTPEPITRKRLAEIVGVSEQMVVKYDKLGIPRAGRARYNEAEAVAWIKAQIGAHGHGGNRGGGRPRGSVAKPKPTTEAEGFRSAHTERIRTQTELANLEIAERVGRLLDRDTVLSANRAHLVVVRQTVERAGAAIAKTIAAEFALDQPQSQAAKRIVREGLEKAFGRIAATPLEL